MKRYFRFFCALALCLALAAPGALCASSRSEVRERFEQLGEHPREAFLREARVSFPYDAGELDADAVNDTLAFFNFIRSLAGLPPVENDRLYGLWSQHAACLIASLGAASHDPVCPEDMSGDFYAAARTGAARGNIALFNWSEGYLLRKGVMYLVRDDGDSNLSTLAHRRWCLSPRMERTGIGFAAGDADACFVLYAVDEGMPAAEKTVLWPCEGAFPADFMSEDTPWSVMLPAGAYEVKGELRATVTELGSGEAFSFSFGGDGPDGWSCVCRDDTGAGPCLIFRPDILSRGIRQYEQNQVYAVSVRGLCDARGADAPIDYTVEMVSLYPIAETGVEADAPALSLSPGQSAGIGARVVPSYADCTELSYSSSDPSVASVDESGTVTAISEGTCTVTAASALGKSAEVEVTVGGG